MGCVFMFLCMRILWRDKKNVGKLVSNFQTSFFFSFQKYFVHMPEVYWFHILYLKWIITEYLTCVCRMRRQSVTFTNDAFLSERLLFLATSGQNERKSKLHVKNINQISLSSPMSRTPESARPPVFCQFVLSIFRAV